MLYFFSSKLKESKLINGINRFFYSPWYMLLVALVMAASNVFSLEFVAFYTYMVFGIYIALFTPDCFPVAPMFCCGYMLFSAGNNPASNYGETLFSVEANVIQFIVIVAVIAMSLIIRFLFEVFVVRRERKSIPALTWGFLALGIAYLLSGAFTEGYGGKELAYSALQIVSLCVTYFYFFYTVDWGERKTGDAAAMVSAVGVGLLIEIVGMYLTPEVLQAIKNDTFSRSMLISGWGVYNNVGGMMAMLMPAPFYFVCTKKNNGAYLLLGTIFFGGVILTQSRGAMLAGGIVYLACCAFALGYLPKGKRLKIILLLVLFFLCAVGIAIGIFIYQERGKSNIMSSVITSGASDSGRLSIYLRGLKRFLEAPIFGSGFYASESIYQYGENVVPADFFIPPRYHNTVVQLLASGGVVAFVAYLFHRVQTLQLFFENPAPHKTFLGLAMAAHLLASLLDCHFFNLGPGLTYGIILLCAEMLPNPKPVKLINGIPKNFISKEKAQK